MTFKKVLIAEDYQDANQGIADVLRSQLQIPDIQEELYCDNAYNRLKVAYANGIPYELLITDLSFKEDHIPRKLVSGIELIRAIRKIQPGLKIIVNSVEDNPVRINTFFEKEKINGFVCKGRSNLKELVRAIHEVYANRTYFSPQIDLTTTDDLLELDDYDLQILKALADGATKKEISERFKKENIRPNSESTLDKRISKLFDVYEAKNTHHLIAKLIRKGKI